MAAEKAASASFHWLFCSYRRPSLNDFSACLGSDARTAPARQNSRAKLRRRIGPINRLAVLRNAREAGGREGNQRKMRCDAREEAVAFRHADPFEHGGFAGVGKKAYAAA